MSANYTLMLLVIAPCFLMGIIMQAMAANRGLSRPAWFVLGFIPFVNLVALILLALKPTRQKTTPQ
ncbi:hypothetical protein F3N42_15095 [Marinihelvus fidelis]|uniref:Uncharacterized protein n=1 Tax=Marinihelvus fidelis TaxID=2613842 RepID=A0A5N0T6B5_9GAMM|nr:hypothetical protein [Marinihelvus fidelis]KAA9129687.1 hypothetical protein F3N42_15095 [Marinihelvus fidelis]